MYSWLPLRHGLGAADGHDVEGANSTTYVAESALGGRGPRAPQRELEPNAAGAYRSGEPGEEAATDDEVYRRWDTDEVAGWILGAFPSIFQNEAGDPYHFKLAKPDLVTWGPHVLRSRNCLGRLLVRVERRAVENLGKESSVRRQQTTTDGRRQTTTDDAVWCLGILLLT